MKKAVVDKDKEVERLDQELGREKGRTLSLDQELKRKSEDNGALQEQLHACEEKLAQWASYRSVLHELDTRAL